MRSEEVLICRCEEVTQAEIQAAIDSGATTIDEIKKLTRAGMGHCQGGTCKHLIQKMLNQSKDANKAPSIRPPLKNIQLGDLARHRADYSGKGEEDGKI